ncbi:hypothetical protein LMG1866_04646 [Achromobacter ruhlandii]|jgi:hypothetical protein|nr:hypothetical protein LMG1866_04646 [Achromobacter ruhlandii]
MPLSYRAKAIILGQNGYRTVLNALFPTRQEADDQALAWIGAHLRCTTVVGPSYKVGPQ